MTVVYGLLTFSWINDSYPILVFMINEKVLLFFSEISGEIIHIETLKHMRKLRNNIILGT